MESLLLMVFISFFPLTVCAAGRVNPTWYACEADSDCIRLPADTCGCGSGGTAVAVHYRFRAAHMAARPKITCVTPLVEHWTCNDQENFRRCRNHECQLVRAKNLASPRNSLLACETIADASGQDLCVGQAAAKLPDYNGCAQLRGNRAQHHCVQAVWDQWDARKAPAADVCARVPQVSADFCPTTRDSCAISAAPKAGLEVCAVVSCVASFNSCVEAAGLPAEGRRRDSACNVFRTVNRMRPTFFRDYGSSLSPDIRGYISGCGIVLP